MGAIDVCPIIPIKNITEAECIELSRVLARKINAATNIPIFLYAKSATKEIALIYLIFVKVNLKEWLIKSNLMSGNLIME
jgi:glutamate formiminotransferase